MCEQKKRSQELLNKVYDHLDSIDVSKLSLNEMKDFLEVVQKGQFLESYGGISALGFGGFGGSVFNAPAVGQGNAGMGAEDSTAASDA